MRVMALLAMMVVSAASLVSSLPELVEKNVLVVDGVSQGWAIEGWFCDPGFGWPSPVEGGGGVPVEPEKKGSIEGGGKRRLLRPRTSIEGGDMLIMILVLMNYSVVYRLLLWSIPSIVRIEKQTTHE